MISVKKITKVEYDALSAGKPSCFTQRSYWSELKASRSNYTPEYYSILKDNDQIGCFTGWIRYYNKFGFKIKTIYLPRTTLFFSKFDLLDQILIEKTLNEIKKIADVAFVEFDFPHWEDELVSTEEWQKDLTEFSNERGFTLWDKEIQPKSTIIKDLSVDDLIASFPSATARKNTRRGLKDLDEQQLEFIVKDSLNDAQLEQAYALIDNIREKNSFNGRDLNYFKEIQLKAENSVIWYLIIDKSKNNKIILANLAIIDKDSSTNYDLYIGRDSNYDKYYISYVLKYLSFEHLKTLGIKFYDHWGIDLDKASPKYGFSMFKLQFGGRIIDYPKILVLPKRFKTMFKLLFNVVYKGI